MSDSTSMVARLDRAHAVKFERIDMRADPDSVIQEYPIWPSEESPWDNIELKMVTITFISRGRGKIGSGYRGIIANATAATQSERRWKANAPHFSCSRPLSAMINFLPQ